jgi:hypothetical protein
MCTYKYIYIYTYVHKYTYLYRLHAWLHRDRAEDQGETLSLIFPKRAFILDLVREIDPSPLQNLSRNKKLGRIII